MQTLGDSFIDGEQDYKSKAVGTGFSGEREACIHTQAFTERSLLYREVLIQRSFYTEKSLYKGDLNTEAFTQTHLHTGGFTNRGSFGAQKFFHRAACTYRSFYTKKPLHKEFFTHRIFCTRKFLHRKAFTHRNFHTQNTESYTEELLRIDAFTQRSLYTGFFTQKPFTHRTMCTK